MSVLCPECESLVVVDVDAVEEGDSIECEECGAELEVLSLEPLGIRSVDAAGYDESDEPTFGDLDD